LIADIQKYQSFETFPQAASYITKTSQIRSIIMAIEYGLNTYTNRINNTSALTLRNFQWTLNSRVARSAQPGYTNHDSIQTMDDQTAGRIWFTGIRLIISANHCPMEVAGINALRRRGIEHIHYPVIDYQAPSADILIDAANQIEAQNLNAHAAMVHCGYGEGRTGTFIAAWALLKHLPVHHPTVNIADLCNLYSLKKLFGVEKPAQVDAIRAALNLPPLTNGAYAMPPAMMNGVPFTAANFGSGSTFTGPAGSVSSGGSIEW